MTADNTHPDHNNGGAAEGVGQYTVEDRLDVLEAQIRTLVEAIRMLSGGLESIPAQETREAEDAARGARLARELLLSKGL